MSEVLITLADGSKVTLDEFITWSAQRQSARLMPKVVREKITNVIRKTHRAVITPIGEFSSLNAAARGLNTTVMKLSRLIYDLDNHLYKFVNELEKDKARYFRSSDDLVKRKVITPSGEFGTVKEASKTLKISEATLKRLIYDITNKGFYFAKELERDKSRYYDGAAKKKQIRLAKKRVVITPKGKFESLSDASEAYGMGVDVLRRYVFNTAYPEFKYEKEEPRDKEKYFHKLIPKAFQKQTVFVRTPKGDFDSIKLAADAYGIEWHQMNRMVASKSHPDFHKFEPNEKAKPLINTRSKKKTVTPLGTFNSKIEAIKAHKISRDEFTALMKKFPKKYYFLEAKNN